MKIEQVAAITHTIRDFIKTEDAFRESCKKLSEIGFQAIELTGMPNQAISAESARQICEDNGLRITSAHMGLAETLERPDLVAENAHKLGISKVAYAYPHNTDFQSKESINRLIENLNKAGEVYHNAGLTFLYHNHALEFRKVDGQSVLGAILSATDPKFVQAELDTYWVQRGGCSPIEWCKKLKNRLPVLHLKDMTVYEGNDSTMGEIGSGNLDFKGIVSAAENSGCNDFVVEQDKCPGDPFDSLRQSFEYIKRELVS